MAFHLHSPRQDLCKRLWTVERSHLINPNKGESTVHGCHRQSDMAVRICEVLARPSGDIRAVTFFKFVSLKK